MTEIHDIAIIGGGASATLLAWNLRHRHSRGCVVIDPGPQPALGLAYGTRSVENLLNVPASGMSALADEAGHFLGWLRRKIDPEIGQVLSSRAPFMGSIFRICFVRQRRCISGRGSNAVRQTPTSPRCISMTGAACARAMSFWHSAILRRRSCPAFPPTFWKAVAITIRSGQGGSSRPSNRPTLCC